MATWNVQEMQDQMASELDQTASKTAGDSDWNLRLNYLNRAQLDFSEAYDWPVLIKELYTQTSQITGNASITLPSDFRKLAGRPVVVDDGITARSYDEIDITNKVNLLGTDYYIYITGNPRANYSMVVNPPSLVSGASIYVPYYSTLASLASPADLSNCPDPEFLVQKALYYVLKGRDDPRFQEAGAKADLLLQRLLEREQVRSLAYDDRIKSRNETKLNFRMGRD